MSALASQWLLDTFIYTGLLIALVLLLRRPVSRHFGPTIAYALWALPLLRFVMPPLVLPASMAPVVEAAPAATGPLMVIISDPQAADAVAAATKTPEVGIALIDVLIPVWLFGAAIFLGWRAREYRRMRADLLAEAKPVGESGKVRLVETPAVTSPVAFGIGDKVVALPPGFMALYDRDARDMAIAHELAHHRGFDLLANILAQPVLALHWFNPLAWWGWRAMRKDQEAACDARVVAGRDKSERAAYAQVIAGFAAGDDLALAAPMACPVLGEKSIIHRLRSLSMSEVPTGRRRLGIAVLATSALALPVTASITYAQAEAPVPPVAPLAPSAALAPAPPAPPEAPAAPDAPEAPASVITSVDPDDEVIIAVEDEDGQMRTHVIRQSFTHKSDAPLSPEERERIRAEVEAELESARAEMERAFAEMDRVHLERAHAQRERHRVIVDSVEFAELDMECTGEEATMTRDLGDGRKAIVICQSVINEQTLNGLRIALDAIRNNPEIPAGHRQEAIESIEEAIEELEEARSTTRAFIRKQARGPRVKSSAFAPATPEMKVTARFAIEADLDELWQVNALVPLRIERSEECSEKEASQQGAGLSV